MLYPAAAQHVTARTLTDFLQFYFYFIVISMYGEPSLPNETFGHKGLLFSLTATAAASAAEACGEDSESCLLMT